VTTPFTVPSGLVGPLGEVRTRLRRQVRDFIAGGPWQPYADDPVEPSGLIVLSPSAALAAGRHVWAYLPLSLLVAEIVAERMDPEQERIAVQASLQTPIGLLGLLAPPNQMLIHPPAVHRPAAEAVARFWPELDAVGARYTIGTTDGARLWDLPTNAQYLLGKVGVPRDALARPLPPGGPAALLPE
jgi:hypothetical protein